MSNDRKIQDGDGVTELSMRIFDNARKRIEEQEKTKQTTTVEENSKVVSINSKKKDERSPKGLS